MQKAARDLAGDDDGGRSTAPATAPAKMTKGAVKLPETAAEITTPPETQVGAWHMEMAAACADNKAEHVAHYDINGDGLPDTVCWRVIRSRAYGNSVDVDARVTAADGHVQSAYMWLPVDPKASISICNADRVSVRQALWSQKDLDDKHWDGDHRVGITVSDGSCEPVHLFWPRNASGDEADFIFER